MGLFFFSCLVTIARLSLFSCARQLWPNFIHLQFTWVHFLSAFSLRTKYLQKVINHSSLKYPKGKKILRERLPMKLQSCFKWQRKYFWCHIWKEWMIWKNWNFLWAVLTGRFFQIFKKLSFKKPMSQNS